MVWRLAYRTLVPYALSQAPSGHFSRQRFVEHCPAEGAVYMSKLPKTLVPCVVAALVVLAFTPHRAFAQNPYVIDGVVPANGTVSGPEQTNDPFGNVRELGPVNSNATKVGVIHSATPPMLSFTNPNGQVDLRRIWTQTTRAANNDIWFYFAWERDANT